MPVSISIVTPVFNSGELLSKLHECLSLQSFDKFEWVVINDGSTDDKTLSILDEIGSMSSHYHIIHTENHGAPAARNKGIARASGKFIKFLDADDLIQKNHLKSQITEINKFPFSKAIVVSPFKILKHLKGSKEMIYSEKLSPTYFEAPLLNSLNEFSFVHSGCLYHTDFVKKHLHWDESLKAHQDLDFLWQAMLAGAEFHVDNNTYFIIREHDITQRITTNKSPEKWMSRFEAVKNIYLKLKDLGYGPQYFRNAKKRFDRLIVGAYQEFPETGLLLLDAKKRLTGEGLSPYLIIRFSKNKIKSFINIK